MLEKASNLLSGFQMTLISGIFLLISLVLLLCGRQLCFDPAWLTVVISGVPLLYLALTRLIFQKWVSSALLISMAMVASIAIGQVFAAGEVAFIMAIGAILEDKTVDRAKKGLTNLIALAPAAGRRLTKGDDGWDEEMIAVDAIRAGDRLRIFPGESVAVDGIIVEGQTSLDQSIMTGESLPVDKSVGDEVFCGTLNCFGAVDIIATKVGEDSSLQKLIRMVQEAEDKKAPMQRIVDRWAVWLVPIALSIAIGGFLLNWWLLGDLMKALNRGVTVLVVFCPCALALATPTSIMAAIGQATKHGVIIKSGEALEKMGKVDIVAFDKTGTLTYGKPAVSDVIPLATVSAPELLALAASAEAKSEHPLARAIVKRAQEEGLTLAAATDFRMEAGRGVAAAVGDRKLFCGNEAYLLEQGIGLFAAKVALAKLEEEGKALILVAGDGAVLGVIGLADSLRPEAKEMVAKLNAMGTKTVLLTGDRGAGANHFAKAVGLSTVHAGLLPAQKMEHIAALQKGGRLVCMIGDGVNDAPALKSADVGVAMASIGSDIAIDAADIALMGDDIAKIPYLKRLSRSTLNTIKGNITASMCINFVAVTLSVLGVLNPVSGALVHNAGSVLVVLNAALLYDRNFE